MSKEIFKRNGQSIIKEGKEAVILKESIGNFSAIAITDKAEIKKLIEASGLTYPAKVISLLEQTNVAILRIIKQGWSINGNYYTTEALKELPKVIEKQGSIQFLNHIEEGTKLDRPWNDFVSYTKYTWFDEATQSVYAVVKFPKEKKDTGWILNVIQEDPEIIGVSISAAVYVTENYSKDGKTGDKVDGWAYFDSADYVIYASAGGQGIEASKVAEKIKHAKEAVNKPVLEVKNEIKENIEKFELVKEAVQSFMSNYIDNQTYYEISAVVNALTTFLNDCWWQVYDTDVTAEERLAAISAAFEQAKKIIMELQLWKNAGAEYDANGNIITKSESLTKGKENFKMKLEELKTQHPEAYTTLMQEAQAIVVATKESEAEKKVTQLTGELATANGTINTLKTEKSALELKVDEFKVKEAVAEKKQLVDKLLKEAKEDKKNALPEIAITDLFVKQLEGMKDEAAIKEAIEDRKKVAAGIKQTPEEHLEDPAKKKDEKVVDMKKIAEELKS